MYFSISLFFFLFSPSRHPPLSRLSLVSSRPHSVVTFFLRKERGDKSNRRLMKWYVHCHCHTLSRHSLPLTLSLD
ncbi:Hypothetical protein, putative [Bodo saltans]|uniref:Uncharacterized protein n=1 Tax=Bodo saltans TaxID=75058 RepID=A0A0S4IPM6_BODSA|nr:Hypothetical protein, putative [Bodo saltans]|eukprot:CUE71418.1 Hypothetical protein, putative [Bodo saltans]